MVTVWIECCILIDRNSQTERLWNLEVSSEFSFMMQAYLSKMLLICIRNISSVAMVYGYDCELVNCWLCG